MIAAAWSLSQTVEQHWKLRSQAVGFLGLAVKEAILRRRNRDVVAVQDRLPLIAFQIEDTSWWAMQPSIFKYPDLATSAIIGYQQPPIVLQEPTLHAATVSFWSFAPRPCKASAPPRRLRVGPDEKDRIVIVAVRVCLAAEGTRGLLTQRPRLPKRVGSL